MFLQRLCSSGRRHAIPSVSLFKQNIPHRAFANINFGAIVPENSVLKVYNQLVQDGQIRSDPKQVAVVGMMDRWQQGFVK